MLGLLATSLLAAPVALHASELLVDAEPAARLLAAVARAIEGVAEHPPIVDAGTGCRGDRACVRAVAERTRAEQIVLFEAQAAATLIRLVLTRHEADGAVVRRVETEIPSGAEEWPLLFESAVRVLFPRPPATAACAEPAPPPPPPPRTRVLGWVGLGTAVAFGGAATALRLSSEGARGDAEALPLGDPARTPLEDESQAHGLASNLLFGIAAALLGAALVHLAGG